MNFINYFKELFQIRAHKNYLADIAVSRNLNKGASCGDNCIKTYDLQDIKDVEAIINVEETNINKLSKEKWMLL
jgi:WD repeat-containing protein 19